MVILTATLAVVALEVFSVHWLVAGIRTNPQPDLPVDVLSQWTALTLPQCWMLGAVVALLYYSFAILLFAKTRDDIWLRNRYRFLRLWRWAMAVGAVQAGTLYFVSSWAVR